MALTDKLTAIADAIRGKTGKTDGLTLDAMVSAIDGIEVGGGGGIHYATGSFTVTSTSSVVTITHNLNSTKVFVVHAVRDNPAVFTARYSGIMGFAISNGIYPQLTVDTSNYNQGNEALVTNFQTGPNDTNAKTAMDIRSPYVGYTSVGHDAHHIVNNDANTFQIKTRERFGIGLVYAWLAVDISGIIPLALEG